MSQSVIIPLGRTLATATVTVPASADGRARLILFGDQTQLNAGIRISRNIAPVAGEGPIDSPSFLKGWEGNSLTLPGPGEYEITRLHSSILLGVVFETGTDLATPTIPTNAPTLHVASVTYARNSATGDFTVPCLTNGALHVRPAPETASAASIVSVNTGASFTAFPSAAGNYVIVANSSNHTLEYQRGSSGSAARLPPGEQRTIPLPTGNASNLSWRALGASHNVVVTGDVYTLTPLPACA